MPLYLEPFTEGSCVWNRYFLNVKSASTEPISCFRRSSSSSSKSLPPSLPLALLRVDEMHLEECSMIMSIILGNHAIFILRLYMYTNQRYAVFGLWLVVFLCTLLKQGGLQCIHVCVYEYMIMTAYRLTVLRHLL